MGIFVSTTDYDEIEGDQEDDDEDYGVTKAGGFGGAVQVSITS